jgi:hypothetical protein
MRRRRLHLLGGFIDHAEEPVGAERGVIEDHGGDFLGFSFGLGCCGLRFFQVHRSVCWVHGSEEYRVVTASRVSRALEFGDGVAQFLLGFAELLLEAAEDFFIFAF